MRTIGRKTLRYLPAAAAYLASNWRSNKNSANVHFAHILYKALESSNQRSGTNHVIKFTEKRPISKANKILSKGASTTLRTRTVQGSITWGIGKQENNFPEFSVLGPWELTQNPLYSLHKETFIRYVKATYMCTNASNGTAIVTIRIIKPKRDQEEAIDTPTDDWAAGLVAMGGTGEYQLPGATPNTSYNFNQKWKVIKTYKQSLASGQSITLNYFYKTNHRLNQRVLNDMITGASAVNGFGQGAYLPLTRYFMVTAHGLPAGDLGVVEDNSTANGYLSQVMTVQVSSQLFETQNASVSYSNTLPTTARQIIETDGDLNPIITAA